MQYEQPASLPKLDQLSGAHCARVARHISTKIQEAGGQISFAEFMHEALYSNGLGYYSAGSIKFGRDGDFITAPEVSAVFGRVLARQCAEVLAEVDSGEILEFGAGSGKLAIDILSVLEEQGMLPVAYNIFEISPDLVERQKNRLQAELPHLVERVRWLSVIAINFEGVIIANEVLDALPVERFVRRESGIFQMLVSLSGDTFVWAETEAPEQLAIAVASIESEIAEPLPLGYRSEVCLASSTWIAELAECLRYGAVFLFDYGVSQREYYAPDRDDGWLRCHYRHHVHNDPLILPGIQDLTVWIDFSSVASAAVAGGFNILGYQTQSQFLMGGGLEIEMQGFTDLPVMQQLELSSQIKTLTLPGEMGENFKCMALGRGDITLPSAFKFADRTQTL